MAFVVCALAMYLLWWHKPFGVESRTSLTVIAYTESDKKAVAKRLFPRYNTSAYRREYRIPYFEEMLGVQSRGQPMQKASVHDLAMQKAQIDHEFYKKDMTWAEFFDIFLGDFQEFRTNGFGELRKALRIIIRNILGNSGFTEPPRKVTRTLALYATGTLFSALHLAAWNWEFPSSTVRELWRIFAIIATGTGPATILFVFAVQALVKSDNDMDLAFLFLLYLFFIFVYAASRIGLVVLIFYCFSSMPAGVYKTVNWLQFLPHFS